MAVYTRQSSSGIVDGGTIEASDLNDEFDQLASAFLAPTFGVGTAGTDIVMTFDGETNDGVITWMEDEDYLKFSDDILLATTEKLQFRDTALYIYSSTDGQLDLVADTEIQIAATTIDINGAVALDGAITGATNITLSGELDAATLDISGNADIDGTLEADAITVDGTTLAEYISDTAGAMFTSNTETGISATYQDGDNTIDLEVAAAQTTITSLLATDIKIGEDDQTKIDFETADEIHFYAANVEQVYLGDNVFGPQSDSDVDLGTTGVRWKDAYIDTVTTTGNVTVGGDLTVTGDDITMNTNTSGAALIADGTNFNPVVISGDISIGTDGVAAIGSGVIVAADIASSAVTTAKINADAVTGAKIADDAIDSEHYTDGSIDNAHIADDAIDSEHYAAGSIDTAHIADDQITLAKMAGLARGKIIYGDSSGNPAALAVGSNGQVIKSDGTDISWGAQSVSSLAADDLSAGDAAVTLSTTSGNITIDATADNSDIIFKGTDATSDITMLTLDGSEAGKAIFNAGITIADAGTIGSASDADSIAIASDGVVTMNQIPVFSAGINVSGGSIAGTLATAAQANITSLGTLTALTVDDVAVNGKVITMTGSASDTAVITAGTHGTLDITTTDAAAAAANIQITADGTAELAGTTVTLDSGADIVLDAAGNNVTFKSGGTSILDFSNSSSDAVVTASVQDKDIIFKGDDGGSAVTALTMDMSAAGKSIFGAAAVGSTQTASATGSTTLDFDTYQNFVLTATGNVTLANPSTESAGQSGVIVLIQDGTGSRTLSTGSEFEWPAGTAGTISTSANAVDVIPYLVDASSSILLGAPQLAFATPS